MKNYCWKSKRAYKPVPAFTVLSWHWSWDFWEYGSELFSVVGGNGAGVWGLRAMTYATVSYRHVKSVWSLYSGMMTRRWSSLLTNVRRAVPCDMACYYIGLRGHADNVADAAMSLICDSHSTICLYLYIICACRCLRRAVTSHSLELFMQAIYRLPPAPEARLPLSCVFVDTAHVVSAF